MHLPLPQTQPLGKYLGRYLGALSVLSQAVVCQDSGLLTSAGHSLMPTTGVELVLHAASCAGPAGRPARSLGSHPPPSTYATQSSLWGPPPYLPVGRGYRHQMVSPVMLPPLETRHAGLRLGSCRSRVGIMPATFPPKADMCPVRWSQQLCVVVGYADSGAALRGFSEEATHCVLETDYHLSSCKPERVGGWPGGEREER